MRAPARNPLDPRKAHSWDRDRPPHTGEHSDSDIGLFVDRLAETPSLLSVLKDLYGLALEVDVHIEPHLFIRSEDRTGFGAVVEESGILL